GGDSQPTPPPFPPPPPPPRTSPEGFAPPFRPARDLPTEPPLVPLTDEEVPPPRADGRPCCTLTLNPRVLDWIPVGCFVVILILTLFPWVRVAPAGYAIYSQNAWQAAFNSVSADKDVGQGIFPGVAGDEKITDHLNVNGW